MKRKRIAALTRLTDERKAQIRELEALCREHDGTEAVAELSNEMNYSRRLRCFFIYYDGDRPVGFMEVFCPDGENAEISAFVAPERRRQGIFSAMYKAVEAELHERGARNLLVVAEPASADAAAAAKKMGAVLKYSELVMKLEGESVKGAENEDSEDAGCNGKTEGENRKQKVLMKSEQVDESEILFKAYSTDLKGQGDSGESAGKEYQDQGDIFGTEVLADGYEIGQAGVYVGERELFIFGVEIEEKYRGKGYGTAFTKALIHELGDRFPDKQIKLQVRSDNVPAMRLYARCGFTVGTQRDYYAISRA